MLRAKCVCLHPYLLTIKLLWKPADVVCLLRPHCLELCGVRVWFNPRRGSSFSPSGISHSNSETTIGSDVFRDGEESPSANGLVGWDRPVSDEIVEPVRAEVYSECTGEIIVVDPKHSTSPRAYALKSYPLSFPIPRLSGIGLNHGRDLLVVHQLDEQDDGYW